METLSTNSTVSKAFARPQWLTSLIVAVILSLTAFGIASFNGNDLASANKSGLTFFFSKTAGCAKITEMEAPVGQETTIYLCADGTNEGAGLLGAEVSANYLSNKLDVTSVGFYNNCVFDSCIDLSEDGSVHVLGASGLPSEDGNPVTAKTAFAIVKVKLTASENSDLNFGGLQVIDENQQVQSRTGQKLTIKPGAPPTCNNGTLESGEDCDGTNLDGNTCQSIGQDFTGGTLKCSASCAFNTASCNKNASCGNGIKETGEQCDDGNTANGDGCSASCKIEVTVVCGEGKAEGAEACDGTDLKGETCQTKGYATGSLTCNANCTLNYTQCSGGVVCGNGKSEAGEQCDDGNLVNGDGCSSVCTTETGGSCNHNGIPEAANGEECDDGNTDTADLCTNACKLAKCGDSYIQTGEQCDDGNTVSGDGCDASCKNELQILDHIDVSIGGGNPPTVAKGGSLSLNTWAYYNSGATKNVTSPNTNPTTYSSSSDYVASMSGSTVLANNAGSAVITASYTEGSVTQTDTQTISVTGTTTPPPPPPATVCGNGIVEGAEQCDDGNTVSGDGCDASCQTEVTPPVVPPVVVPPVTPPVTPPGGPSLSCPNGICDATEDATTCPADCGVRPVAPDVSAIAEKAVTENPLEQVAVKVAPPVPEQMDRCTIAYSDDKVDTDGDGLSDRTECYIGTDPHKWDTDGDTCGDGDEMNQFYTSPLNGTDCKVSDQALKVVITDPQPGWIVPKLTVRGYAPKDSNLVSLVAFPADYRVLNALIKNVEAVKTNLADTETVKNILDSLTKDAVPAAELFVSTYKDYPYAELSAAVESVKNLAASADPATNVDAVLAQLMALKKERADLGATANLKNDVDLGGMLARNFEMDADENAIEKDKLYDLVAVATVGGNTVSSAPVRFSLASEVGINKPIPRSIGNQTIPGSVAFKNLLIGGALAQGNGAEIEISDSRPLVSGDTEFGSQVFAVWESVVLASSVISDSEQGAFTIQAPKNLDTNVSHKVTLYAVKTGADKTLRSESVNVYFRVTTAAFPWRTVYFAIATILLLALFSYALGKRLKKAAPVPVAEIEKAYMPVSPATLPAVTVLTPEAKPAEHPGEFAHTFRSESAAPAPLVLPPAPAGTVENDKEWLRQMEDEFEKDMAKAHEDKRKLDEAKIQLEKDRQLAAHST